MNSKGNRMKVTTRGRITIPVEVRKKLNISPGTEVEFIYHKGQVLMTKKTAKSNIPGRRRDALRKDHTD